jgi:hypothetical protein
MTNQYGGINIVEHCGDGDCLYNIKDDPEEQVAKSSDKKSRYLERDATETGQIPGNLFQSWKSVTIGLTNCYG